MKWWPALVTLVALAPVGVSAVAWADAKIILESSTAKMSVEDEIRVTARASGSFDQMSELSADGFDFRQAGHQQQRSVIGRQMQQTESLLYIGTPQRPGKFTIGPLVLLQDGKIVAKSEVLHVEVTAVQEELSSGPAEKLTDLSQYAGQPFFVHPTLSVVQPNPFCLAMISPYSGSVRPYRCVREGLPPSPADGCAGGARWARPSR